MFRGHRWLARCVQLPVLMKPPPCDSAASPVPGRSERAARTVGSARSWVWILGTCLLLAGGAACASGGAPLGQVVTLLVGVLAAGLGSLMVSGCGIQKAPQSRDTGTDNATPDGTGADAPPTDFVCSAGSKPPGAPGTVGWVRCCLGNQTRACPPPPPTWACNYGLDTFCPDGITCGDPFKDPCGTGGKTDGGSPDAPTDTSSPDAPIDTAMDTATDTGADQDAPKDLTADVVPSCGTGSLPSDGGMPDGWSRCCLGEARWCPPHPTTECNYAQAQFCADGITCGFPFQDPCGVDGGSGDVRP